MTMLSPHFSEAEFRCRGGCGIVNVSPLLLAKLERMRKKLGRPMPIRSGCRCPAHNRAVGGKARSAHITTARKPCLAADIRITGGNQRYLVVKAAYGAGLKRIGPHNSFVHVDVAKSLPRDVLFVYPR